MTNPEVIPPTGKNLLDQESREKLPELYSGEEKGLDTLAQVKFFTPVRSGRGTPVSSMGRLFSLALLSGSRSSSGIFL